MQLLDDMLIHFVSFCFSLQQFLFTMLQAYGQAHLLATNCQTCVIGPLPLVGKTWCTGSPRKIEQLQHDDENKHITGFFAAVKLTISFLKVSEIETEARPSPGTN